MSNSSIETSPRYPLYIVSKGRSQYMMTSKALTKMKLPHYIIVEPQQVTEYQAAINKWNLLTTIIPLDMSYKEKYQLCDSLGLSKSTGSGPARNFAWDHSISQGHKFHWVMDDNIRYWQRLHNNLKIICYNGVPFRAIEDFTDKYLNVGMAGPQYSMFVPRKTKVYPYILNTRIYSCNLIRNSIPFRWRGRYNEDTILSLDMLKKGWCTLLVQAFLQYKMPTQKMTGGNTTEIYDEHNKQSKTGYSKTGTIEKSNMLVREHGDVARVTFKFSRVHHSVNYAPFQANKLIKNPNWIPPKDPNYGMELKKIR